MKMSLGGSVKLNHTGVTILVLVCLLTGYLLFPSRPNQNTIGKNEAIISLKTLLQTSIRSAIAGGLKVVEVRSHSDLKEGSKGKTKEGANDPVTDGDMLSHFAMVGVISEVFPHISIVSEEKPKQPEEEVSYGHVNIDQETQQINGLQDELVSAKDVLIWIDPLDATQEYTENLTQYVTTMVCISHNGRPIIGVIHNPFTRLTAWGWVGKGFSSNLRYNLNKKSTAKKIIVSRSHKGKVEEIVKSSLGVDWQVVPAGGAGYKTLEVANGSVDAYVHTTLIKKWDICAGNAILESMGGEMTTIDGSAIDYSSAEDFKNEGGLLGTLKKNKWILGKFKGLKL